MTNATLIHNQCKPVRGSRGIEMSEMATELGHGDRSRHGASKKTCNNHTIHQIPPKMSNAHTFQNNI